MMALHLHSNCRALGAVPAFRASRCKPALVSAVSRVGARREASLVLSNNVRGVRSRHTIRSAAVEDTTSVQVENLESLAEAAQKAADLGAQVRPCPDLPHRKVDAGQWCMGRRDCLRPLTGPPPNSHTHTAACAGGKGRPGQACEHHI